MLLRPLLTPLLCNRMMPVLVATQVALACAILANVLYLLYQQAAPMLVNDGIVRNELLLVDQLISRKGSWTRDQIETGTRTLQALPGVRSVSTSFGLPMKQTLTMTYTVQSPSGVNATVSGFGGEGLVDTLGLQLVAGRDFNADDYTPFDMSAGKDDAPARTTPVILTEALARALFPEGEPLGKILRSPDPAQRDTFIVVGLVAHLLRYQLGELNDGKAEYSMLTPTRITSTPILSYAVRTEPQRPDGLRQQIETALKQQFGQVQMEGIAVKVEDYEQLREEGFRSRRAAVWLFGTVCVVVTLITAVGIASLTAYWVEQRTRQIGIRRALGATRRQILRHFQAENLIVAGSGVVLGVPLALAANQLLMHWYALPRLPWNWLPLGAVALLMLGQLAVLWPARRAASVPPAIATRAA